MKRRLLITGAGGFLGRHLCLAAKEKQIFALCRERPCMIKEAQAVRADLRDPESIARAFTLAKPDLVLHAAALADPEACEKDPEESRRINLEATRILAGLCAQSGARMLFVSTDLVFDGSKGDYRETDSVNPLGVYSRHKAEAEEAVLLSGAEALVCRIPLLYGDCGPHDRSCLQGLIGGLSAGREVGLFHDEYRTPLSGREAARWLLHFLDSEQRGLLHLAGPSRLSRLEFGLLAAKAFGLSPQTIIAKPQSSAQTLAKRPPDVSLNIALAQSLGYAPRHPEEELALAAGLSGQAQD